VSPPVAQTLPSGLSVPLRVALLRATRICFPATASVLSKATPTTAARLPSHGRYLWTQSLAVRRRPLSRELSTHFSNRSPYTKMTLSRRTSSPGPGIPRREDRLRPVELVTDSLETPSLDDRTYRVIRLPNNLEALLVHDPQTDKASAAVDVGVGSYSDEDDMPGMAHAVEHVSSDATVPPLKLSVARCICF
jgi:hypothetical protein